MRRVEPKRTAIDSSAAPSRGVELSERRSVGDGHVVGLGKRLGGEHGQHCRTGRFG